MAGPDKKRETSEGVEVVKYDRALLETHEVQPIATEDGHTIVVNRHGWFAAKVGDVEISERTLEKAKEKVHRTHLALVRRKAKKKMAVPCYVYDDRGDDKYIGRGFFRGIHAGNGDLLYSRPDGTKGSGSYVIVFPKAGGDEKLERIRELADEKAKLVARLDALDEEFKPLLYEQKEAMLARVKTPYSRSYYVRNDAARAQEIADGIAEYLRGEER